jgi:hypothetical protein
MSQTKIKPGGRWVEWTAKASSKSGKIRTHLTKFSDIVIVNAKVTLARVSPQHDQRFADHFAKEHSVTWRFVDPPSLDDIVEVACGRNVLGDKPAVRHQAGCKRCGRALGRPVSVAKQLEQAKPKVEEVPSPLEFHPTNGGPPVLTIPKGYVACGDCVGPFGKRYQVFSRSDGGIDRIPCKTCDARGYVMQTVKPAVALDIGESSPESASRILEQAAGDQPVAASAQPVLARSQTTEIKSVAAMLRKISDEAMELASQAEGLEQYLGEVAEMLGLKAKLAASLKGIAPTVRRLSEEAGIDLEESPD